MPEMNFLKDSSLFEKPMLFEVSSKTATKGFDLFSNNEREGSKIRNSSIVSTSKRRRNYIRDNFFCAKITQIVAPVIARARKTVIKPGLVKSMMHHDCSDELIRLQ